MTCHNSQHITRSRRSYLTWQVITPPVTSAGHISSCWWQLRPRSLCPAADLRGAKRYLTICQTTTFCISQVLHSNNGESTPQQWFIHQTLSEMILIHQAVNREPCCMAMLHGMLFKLKTSTKIQKCSEKINRQLYNICGNWNASAETTVHVDRNIIEIHRASGDIWYKNVQNQHIRSTPGTTWPLK